MERESRATAGAAGELLAATGELLAADRGLLVAACEQLAVT